LRAYYAETNKYNYMKNIGILGSGPVAQALGQGFLKNGYNVMLGTRESSKLEEWRNKNGERAQAGTFSEVAEFGELIVLAVKGSAAKTVVKPISDKLKGKTVIDTTNPIAEAAPENGVLLFFTNQNKSLMEDLQEHFPEVNFVKAFSCIGSPFMVNPPFQEKPSMFICGNNENAKSNVKEIVEKFGHEVEDMGSAEAARAIEPLCILWCIPGFRSNEWSHAFRLVHA
jgi:predicted dinucleotide-binding enzyme